MSDILDGLDMNALDGVISTCVSDTTAPASVTEATPVKKATKPKTTKPKVLNPDGTVFVPTAFVDEDDQLLISMYRDNQDDKILAAITEQAINRGIAEPKYGAKAISTRLTAIKTQIKKIMNNSATPQDKKDMYNYILTHTLVKREDLKPKTQTAHLTEMLSNESFLQSLIAK